MEQQQPQSEIARTAARLARQVEIALAKMDLSLAQFRVLYQLDEGTVASSLLATQIAVSPPSITNVVEGLVQRGLVQREHSDNDRRRVVLTLTAKGQDALREGERAVEVRLHDLAAEVDISGYAKKALSGLASWNRALEAHRTARRAAKQAGELAR